jgi:hypothetical protein
MACVTIAQTFAEKFLALTRRIAAEVATNKQPDPALCQSPSLNSIINSVADHHGSGRD